MVLVLKSHGITLIVITQNFDSGRGFMTEWEETGK